MALATLLYTHVRSRGLGEVLAAPTDCILSDHTVVQPDILYVERDRLAIVSRRGIEGAPTLVVEVLSPTTAAVDLGRKRGIYARHGVPWHWIVDPETRVIEGYRLASAATNRWAAWKAATRSPFRPSTICSWIRARSGLDAGDDDAPHGDGEVPYRRPKWNGMDDPSLRVIT